MDLLASRQLPMELPMHNARPLHRRVVLLGLTLVACDPAKLGTLDGEATGSSGDDPSDTASDDAGSQTGPVTSSASNGPSSDDGATSSSGEGGTFPDVGDGATSSTTTTDGDPTGIDGEACDIWAQDCPDGEKCNPWANDGGTVWNANGCFPVEPEPAQLGDECLVEGSGTSGVDNCALGSMCWDVDAETSVGECVSLCVGSPDDPQCDDASFACAVLNDAVLPLCLPLCDPLLQDCDEGLGCYPVAERFVCVPDISGESGLYLEPCTFPGDCDPGNACVSADAVAGCESAGCCTAYCDISLISPGCPGASECLAFFEEGFAPPGLENVGLCS